MTRMPERFQQDPHNTADFTDTNLQTAIGRQVRLLRRKKGLTIAQMAQAAGLSNGMLSKIENGQTAPSLHTLQHLSEALSEPLTALFRGYGETRAAMHVKAGHGIEADRAGTRAGHHYTLLGNITGSGPVTMEPYLITLSAKSDVFPAFQHEGLEFLYMLEGCVDYHHGTARYRLEPGDSFIFDADAPHGPGRLVDLPARYLSIICYPRENPLGKV